MIISFGYDPKDFHSVKKYSIHDDDKDSSTPLYHNTCDLKAPYHIRYLSSIKISDGFQLNDPTNSCMHVQILELILKLFESTMIPFFESGTRGM